MPETKTLAYYENLKYPIEILEDEDAYVASIPDLPGCVSYGDTIEQAMESLRSVKKLWLEGRLEANLSIPEPAELEEYSGRFVLRISRSLHKALQREAKREGLSLNQHIGQILAERHELVDLERAVQVAVSKCLTRPVPTAGSGLAYWNVESRPAAHVMMVNSVSLSNEQFGENLIALVGEKHRKSVVCERYESDWTGYAQKKAKARAHHC